MKINVYVVRRFAYATRTGLLKLAPTIEPSYNHLRPEPLAFTSRPAPAPKYVHVPTAIPADIQVNAVYIGSQMPLIVGRDRRDHRLLTMEKSFIRKGCRRNPEPCKVTLSDIRQGASHA